jgi:hypothetical protein
MLASGLDLARAVQRIRVMERVRAGREARERAAMLCRIDSILDVVDNLAQQVYLTRIQLDELSRAVEVIRDGESGTYAEDGG